MSDLATAVAAIIRQVLLHVDADVKSGIAQVIAGSARRRLPPRRRRGGRHLIAERVTAAQDIAISRDEAAVILLDIAEAPPEPIVFEVEQPVGGVEWLFPPGWPDRLDARMCHPKEEICNRAGKPAMATGSRYP